MWLNFEHLPYVAFSATIYHILYFWLSEVPFGHPGYIFYPDQGQCERLWLWKSEILWHKNCSFQIIRKSQNTCYISQFPHILVKVQYMIVLSAPTINTYHMYLKCEKMWLSVLLWEKSGHFKCVSHWLSRRIYSHFYIVYML